MEHSQRLDKFLWAARFAKTRRHAQELIEQTRPRINNRPTTKPHALIRTGDILTFAQGQRVRVVRIKALSERRLSASLACTLFDEDPD